MKKVGLEELLSGRQQELYESQYKYVLSLIEEGRIKPVKRSPGNGKKPALHTMYWLIEEEPDYSDWRDELLFRTDPGIHVDYYLKHLDVYDQERACVRRLQAYLKTQRALLETPVSRNERSFEIWGEEKFLSGGAGRGILGHCGIDEKELNTYSTAEPFAYFAADRRTPQKLLILENKDPFFGMRKHLLEGNKRIFGEEISTLIYGAGKRVVSSFREFAISAEPYMKKKENEILYFGDLDYEGIGIFETLSESFADQGTIRPFLSAYLAMLDKGEKAASLPPTKEQQNRNISGRFFSFFDERDVRRMKTILEEDKYIPQEILNIGDY